MFNIKYDPEIKPLTIDSVGFSPQDGYWIKEACVLTGEMSQLAASCVGPANFTPKERERITEWFGNSTPGEVEPSVLKMNSFLQNERETVTFVDATRDAGD